MPLPPHTIVGAKPNICHQVNQVKTQVMPYVNQVKTLYGWPHSEIWINSEETAEWTNNAEVVVGCWSMFISHFFSLPPLPVKMAWSSSVDANLFYLWSKKTKPTLSTSPNWPAAGRSVSDTLLIRLAEPPAGWSMILWSSLWPWTRTMVCPAPSPTPLSASFRLFSGLPTFTIACSFSAARGPLLRSNIFTC